MEKREIPIPTTETGAETESRRKEYEAVYHQLRAQIPGRDEFDGFSVTSFDENEQENGKLFAFLEEDNTLHVIGIKIVKENRGKGLAKLLFARMLMENPDAVAITGAFSEDNEEIFWRGIKKGLSPENAIKETPAYKIRSSFGFTELADAPEYVERGQAIGCRMERPQ